MGILNTPVFAMMSWQLEQEMTTQDYGLLHSHTLTWCKDKTRPQDIDNVISTELPDPQLFDIIKSHMVHGPCGALNQGSPCMAESKCTTHFPKQLIQEVKTSQDGYPLYWGCKPDGGRPHDTAQGSWVGY